MRIDEVSDMPALLPELVHTAENVRGDKAMRAPMNPYRRSQLESMAHHGPRRKGSNCSRTRVSEPQISKLRRTNFGLSKYSIQDRLSFNIFHSSLQNSTPLQQTKGYDNGLGVSTKVNEKTLRKDPDMPNKAHEQILREPIPCYRVSYTIAAVGARARPQPALLQTITSSWGENNGATFLNEHHFLSRPFLSGLGKRSFALPRSEGYMSTFSHFDPPSLLHTFPQGAEP
ncbi:uncharacterized protein PAC_08909 [Phialocephala subalpina]|uniref:Uncharacterized protein n=1 Tax=Phialocephala subalpina TaxID=576137 RepID=A0A1L7X1W3_9HELO|nr:uncharacterized protein PAC_08909 [Phialocephala subalpina]